MRGNPPENLDGRKFERLTVEREADERTAAGKRRFVCRCDCGKEKTVIGADLKSGRTTSCGCVRSEGASARSESRREDLTGRAFGAVKVVGLSSAVRRSRRGAAGTRVGRMWDCECPCGGIFAAPAAALKLGQVSGCGCVHRARSAEAAKAREDRVVLFGEEMPISTAAAVSGVAVPTIRHRIKRQGMAPDVAAVAPKMRDGRPGQRRDRVPF